MLCTSEAGSPTLPTVETNPTPEWLRGSVVLLGSSGMLGRAWREELSRRGVDLRTPREDELDLAASTGPAMVTAENMASIATSGDHDSTHARMTIINCAAYTDVDRAEADEALARLVNSDGVARLARACSTLGATLVHYSTDYVFDGTADTPYRVDRDRSPINAYGRSKAGGERAIEAEHGLEALLVRTSWLYAPWGRNFVRTIARIARERDAIDVVNDQRGRPTSAQRLVKTTIGLLDHGVRGIWHATDAGSCTWHEFACAIVARVRPSCRVNPCSSEAFPRPAPRPKWSVLDTERTEALLGSGVPWRSALAEVLDVLESADDPSAEDA